MNATYDPQARALYVTVHPRPNSKRAKVEVTVQTGFGNVDIAEDGFIYGYEFLLNEKLKFPGMEASLVVLLPPVADELRTKLAYEAENGDLDERTAAAYETLVRELSE